MSWSDRDWDNYVRGQPGTFWGEEKIRQQKQLERSEISTDNDEADAHRTSRQSEKKERTPEEYLHGLIASASAIGGGYLAYRLGAEEGWVIFLAFMGAALAAHSFLASAIGKKLLSFLAMLIGVALMVGVIAGIVQALD